MQEIEIKLLEIDVQKVRKILLGIGIIFDIDTYD